MPNLIDLKGQTFERLTVVAFVGLDKRQRALWGCQCSCGGELKAVASSNLRRGLSRSCGCLRREQSVENGRRTRSHGFKHSPEYAAYMNAKYRCTNPNAPDYSDYGGRGIKFVFTSFVQFINHVGLKPSPDLELDRINNEGHYEIGNVRWTTRSIQSRNRRTFHHNHRNIHGR